jgi:hypothetical protein
MRRRLFTLAAGASLGLCVATMVLLGLSYRWHYRLQYRTYVHDPVKPHHGICTLLLLRGQFFGHRRWDDTSWAFAGAPRGWEMIVDGDRTQPNFFVNPPSEFWIHLDKDGWIINTPMWVVAALLAVLPAFWVGGSWLRRRKRAAGLCRVCGYDLRASRDRCPECGTAIAPPDRAAESIGSG